MTQEGTSPGGSGPSWTLARPSKACTSPAFTTEWGQSTQIKALGLGLLFTWFVMLTARVTG
jgi:hypothetical protein